MKADTIINCDDDRFLNKSPQNTKNNQKSRSHTDNSQSNIDAASASLTGPISLDQDASNVENEGTDSDSVIVSQKVVARTKSQDTNDYMNMFTAAIEKAYSQPETTKRQSNTETSVISPRNLMRPSNKKTTITTNHLSPKRLSALPTIPRDPQSILTSPSNRNQVQAPTGLQAQPNGASSSTTNPFSRPPAFSSDISRITPNGKSKPSSPSILKSLPFKRYSHSKPSAPSSHQNQEDTGTGSSQRDGSKSQSFSNLPHPSSQQLAYRQPCIPQDSFKLQTSSTTPNKNTSSSPYTSSSLPSQTLPSTRKSKPSSSLARPAASSPNSSTNQNHHHLTIDHVSHGDVPKRSRPLHNTEIQSYLSIHSFSNITQAPIPIASGSSSTSITSHPRLATSKSAYDLFTPPETRSPSRVSRKQRVLLSYVSMPPFPVGKKKKDYRPLKQYMKATFSSLEVNARFPQYISVLDPLDNDISLKRKRKKKDHIGPETESRKKKKRTMLEIPAISTNMRAHSTLNQSVHMDLETQVHNAEVIPIADEEEEQSTRLKVYRIKHVPPAGIYMNIRHLQSIKDPVSWIKLGLGAKQTCFKPLTFLSRDQAEDSDDDAEYHCGGRIGWLGCDEDSDEDGDDVVEALSKDVISESQLETTEHPKRICQNKHVQKPISSKPTVSAADIDLSQTSDREEKKKRSKKHSKTQPRQELSSASGSTHHQEDAHTSTNLDLPLLSQVTINESESQLPTLDRTVDHGSGSGTRQVLSEKAQGKQKAVDPPGFEETSVLDVISPARSNFEQYIDFSPDTSKQHPRNSPIESRMPTLALKSQTSLNEEQQDINIGNFFWRHSTANTDSLFLLDAGPSVFNNGLDMMGTFDHYNDMLDFSIGKAQSDWMNVATAGPSFLVGNSAHESTTGISLGLRNIGQSNDGTQSTMSMGEDYQIDDMVVGFDVEMDLNTKGDAKTRTGTLSILSDEEVVMAEEENGEDETSSDSISLISSVYLSSVGKTWKSNPESEDDSLYPESDPSSTSGTVSEHGVKNMRGRKKSTRLSKHQKYHKSVTVDASEPNSLAESSRSADVVPVVPTGTIGVITSNDVVHMDWKCGGEDSFCHQCRRKSKRLKMVCLCRRKYCNRCIFIRYPTIAFEEKPEDFECPACRNECNCDICCRKRGEEYVGFRGAIKTSLHDTTKVPLTTTARQRQSTPLKKNHQYQFPSPEPIAEDPGAYTYWGNVYDYDGRKIAIAFKGSREDGLVVVNPVQGYAKIQSQRQEESTVTPPPSASHGAYDTPRARTFLGAYQPSWCLGDNPIITDLEESSDLDVKKKRRSRKQPKVQDDDTEVVRWFVGKKRLLYCPVVPHSRDLPESPTLNPFSDLSSLSSLSDESDIEVEVEVEVEARSLFPDKAISVNRVRDTIKNFDFDPNIVESKDTIRTVALALEACGVAVKIDSGLLVANEETAQVMSTTSIAQSST